MDDKKIYNLGLICGRFGHIHLGHISLIKPSLLLCKRTLILVGSAQESKTLRNPFTIDTRINAIKKCFPTTSEETLIIKKLNDLTNEFDFSVDWGGYVKQTVEKYMGQFADFMVYGNDESRDKWFTNVDISCTSKLILPRDLLPISATMLRGFLLIDDKKSWEKYTPELIHDMYDDLRIELLNVPIYSQIYNELSNSSKNINDFFNVYEVYEKKDKEEKLSKIL